jgi:hypothetical protein
MQCPGGRLGPLGLKQPMALLGKRHKTGGIHLPGRHHQAVAGGLGDQHTWRHPRRAIRLQHPAQVRHVGLQRGGRLAGWLLTPQLLDQPVQRHHLVGVHQQHRQQDALLWPSQLEGDSDRG